MPNLPQSGSLYNGAKDAAAGKNSAGTWSLVMGIAAVILGIPLVTSLFSFLAGIAAIIWGGIGLARANRYGVKRGASVAGMILGILTVLLALVWFGSAY